LLTLQCLETLLAALALAALPALARSQGPCAPTPVADMPPDSFDAPIADSLFARSNYVSLLPEPSDSQPRNVVMVAFNPSSTHAQRQAAVHAVCGRVFGGAISYTLLQMARPPVCGALSRFCDPSQE
jgi:hypothetical protein